MIKIRQLISALLGLYGNSNYPFSEYPNLTGRLASGWLVQEDRDHQLALHKRSAFSGFRECLVNYLRYLLSEGVDEIENIEDIRIVFTVKPKSQGRKTSVELCLDLDVTPIDYETLLDDPEEYSHVIFMLVAPEPVPIAHNPAYCPPGTCPQMTVYGTCSHNPNPIVWHGAFGYQQQ